MVLKFVRMADETHPAWKDLQFLSDNHYHSDFKHQGPRLETQKGIFWVVAYADGRPVGYVECGKSWPGHEKNLVIFSYYTRPTNRKKGVALALTKYVVSYARALKIARVVGPLFTEKAVKIAESFRKNPRKMKIKNGIRRAESVLIHPATRDVVIRVRPFPRRRRKAT